MWSCGWLFVPHTGGLAVDDQIYRLIAGLCVNLDMLVDNKVTTIFNFYDIGLFPLLNFAPVPVITETSFIMTHWQNGCCKPIDGYMNVISKGEQPVCKI